MIILANAIVAVNEHADFLNSIIAGMVHKSKIMFLIIFPGYLRVALIQNIYQLRF